MAHHSAELIKLAETTKGAGAPEAQRKCREAILQLWEHRKNLLTHRRPLESFIPIQETLNNISPSGSGRYFHLHKKPRTDEIGKLLDAAENIDATARSLISWFITQAAELANKKEKKWIKNGLSVTPSFERKDIDIIINYVSLLDEQKDIKSERLEEILKSLSTFSKISKDLMPLIQAELKKAREEFSRTKKKGTKKKPSSKKKMSH